MENKVNSTMAGKHIRDFETEIVVEEEKVVIAWSMAPLLKIPG
ncbi:MAG: hypothetical protein U5N58_13665 [Actinomycetota bacterium]|nr:hypothetical protein [Actinomycetota bacterium]